MSRSSTAVIAFRVALLVLAAGAVVAGLLARNGPGARQPPAGSAFVCPMHPAVTSGAPGRCPICGMDLEPSADRSPAAPIEPPRLDVVRTRVLSRDVIAPAWVEPSGGRVAAILYNDEADGLAADEEASFLPADRPEDAIPVRLASGPHSVWDAATARVTFRTDREVAPGVVGWVRLASRPRPVLVVPTSAVLRSPRGVYVLAVSGRDGEPERRPVTLGKTLVDVTTVVAGVSEGERVVARSAFLVDAERRLRGTPAP